MLSEKKISQVKDNHHLVFIFYGLRSLFLVASSAWPSYLFLIEALVKIESHIARPIVRMEFSTKF